MATLAHVGLDCMHKLRVHYVLPQPLDERLLAFFDDATVSVQEFSRLVAGAKSHVTIVMDERFRAAGVLGECRLVVTYGKPAKGKRPDGEIGKFERRLARAGMGPITYGARKKPGVPAPAAG